MSTHSDAMAHDDQRQYLDSDELKEYRKMVETAAASSEQSVFGNGTFAHAQIVIEVMFRSASKAVKMMADRTKDNIYSSPSITKEVEDFLLRGGNLQIVATEGIGDSDEKFWALVCGRPSVEVREMPLGLKDDLKEDLAFHLLIGDERNVRYEHDSRVRKAIVSFNDADYAKSCSELFDLVWGMSEVAEKAA